MKDTVITGIDIGTHSIKLVVSSLDQQGQMHVLGVVHVPSSGMHNGYITDIRAVTSAIRNALDKSVKLARKRPDIAYISIGGASLDGTRSSGVTYIRNAESTISTDDIKKALESAATKIEEELVNKRVLHDIPIASYVDEEAALASPLGMRASKLETDVMLVHALETHIDDFVAAVEDAGVEVADVMASALAASVGTLTTPQKMQGCLLVDIGAESTEILVYDNDTPIALNTIQMGGNDITNAIALALKIDPKEAESLKRSAPNGLSKEHERVYKIIENSVKKLFTEIKSALAERDVPMLLPSGVLITGGGARTHDIDSVARSILKLPAKVLSPQHKKIYGNPEFSVAYGVALFGASAEAERAGSGKFKAVLSRVGKWFKQLLP